MEVQYKQFKAPFEVKEAGEGSEAVAKVRAYACCFGNVDSWGDIIAPGACDAFLASEDAARMRLCYQHHQDEVIGLITAKGVDETGLWFEADILPTSLGKDVAILLKAGAIDEFSIGYFADEYHEERRDGQDLRILDAITIIEASPVSRAANPRAKTQSVKGEGEKKETPTNHNIMTEQEIKAMQESINAATAANNELKSQLEEKTEEINNLDASVKSQKTEMEKLRKLMQEKPKSYAKMVREALESKRESIDAFFKNGTGSKYVEFKVATPKDAIAFGSVKDEEIGAVPVLGNAFYLAFFDRQVDGNSLAWNEASNAANVGYVKELAASSKTEVTFNEKHRKMAKAATYMEISSEVENWFEELYNFCVQEGQRLIQHWLDGEIWKGNGADVSQPDHVYGIKTNCTAFANLATYENPTIGDVILDAIAQVKKAGFVADTCILSYANEAVLKGVKDKNGNYIYNQLTGMFGQVRVLPSDQMTNDEILVADHTCCKVRTSSLYELEFSRTASTDSWRVDLRRHAQNVIKEAGKKGLVYVANVKTAITAITPGA